MRVFYKEKYGIVWISAILLIVFTSIGVIKTGFFKKKINHDVLVENLQLINNECNSIYEDVVASEEKYLKLQEEESDYFKKGMYSSALVQVYTVLNDYEKIDKYGRAAIENYNKVEGGEYYSISEGKYLAWAMLKVGKYTESFELTSELLETLNSSGQEILTEEEIKDTEALIYSIFLCIYSDFKITDKAQFYYDKLNSIEITPEIERSRGEKIAYSKMLYAYSIDNPILLKEYADECYEIAIEKDKINGMNLADSVIVNVASVDIKLGNYEQALKEIKISETFFKNMKDNYGLAATYEAYAEYYSAIGDLELSKRYYEEAIKIYSDAEDIINLKSIITKYINFMESNGRGDEVTGYYKELYRLNNEFNSYKSVNELLSKIVDINNELNESTITYLKNSAQQTKKNMFFELIVIIILSCLTIKMKYLIKKKNESEKKLIDIANRDYLTGVNTRSYGYELISNEIKNHRNFSIGIIDIDNFKSINDEFGHIFGDSILKVVASTLKKRIAKDDIIFRFGGEEFVIAFMDKNEDTAKQILDAVRVEVSEIKFENNVRVSFSGGVSEWKGIDIEATIKKADELLYKAKKEGKNKIEII